MRAMTLIARYLTKPHWNLANPCRGNPVHNFHHDAFIHQPRVDTVNTPKHGPRFWLGNLVLTLAFICLFFMADLSALLGVWAMVLWMGLAGAGFYLLTSERDSAGNLPD